MAEESRAYAGLCADCRWARLIRSDRGSIFIQCGKFFEDDRYPKYPRLPVHHCVAYSPHAGEPRPETTR